METEKLRERLNQISEEVKLRRAHIESNEEYESLKDTQNYLVSKKGERERELRKLEKKIYEKYIHNPRSMWSFGKFEIKRIKSSVKQGIKKGLGITNISMMSKYALNKIVQQLIDKDSDKIKKQTDKIKKGIKKTEIELTRNQKERKKLMEELNPLIREKEEIYDKLDKEENHKVQGMAKKEKEIKLKINNLPKFIDKIVKEVNKRLMLDELKADG